MNEISYLFVQLESSFIRTINQIFLMVDSMASTIEHIFLFQFKWFINMYIYIDTSDLYFKKFLMI